MFLERDGDGRWVKIDVPGAAGEGRQFGDDVCANDLGFVAVGSGALAPAWFSPDGLTWGQATGLDGDLRACGATSHGFVAVGTASADVAAFTSANGSGWSRVTGPSLTGPEPEHFAVRGSRPTGTMR